MVFFLAGKAMLGAVRKWILVYLLMLCFIITVTVRHGDAFLSTLAIGSPLKSVIPVG
jgi:hypothetical protein